MLRIEDFEQCGHSNRGGMSGAILNSQSSIKTGPTSRDYLATYYHHHALHHLFTCVSACSPTGLVFILHSVYLILNGISTSMLAIPGVYRPPPA